MWYLAVIIWLVLGVWGSYIGNNFMVRHYGKRKEWWEIPLLSFLVIGGPINLLVTVALFWKR